MYNLDILSIFSTIHRTICVNRVKQDISKFDGFLKAKKVEF